RILHMNHMAMQVLQDTPVIAGNPYLFPGQKPGQPLNNVTKPFNRMLKRAQIEGQVCIHTCRHSVAALIVSSGGTLYDVQAQLGHSSSQSSQRYAHLHASRLRHTSAQVANCVEQALIAPSSVKAESIALQRAG
ncbi:MAG: tyrosine-type recombinase/integrase, partial [Plesiomonas shigelloides]